MENILLFGIEVAISAGMSTAVLTLLSTPLRNALEDLCPTAKQADFWVAYTRIMLFLAPLMLVMLVDSLTVNQDNIIDNIQISLVAALAGMLLGMMIVGRKVFTPGTKVAI